MPEARTDRQVYEGRVNAAMDYVEAHLADELTIETLAQVAHFSPFHFHRIFSAVTGETIGTLISRVRIPVPRAGTVQRFRKIGTREAQAISKVVVAFAAACLFLASLVCTRRR